MILKFIITISVFFVLTGCGKIGPLALPDNKLDKSVITYPCDTSCMKKFEAEKKRQKSVSINTE